MNARTATLDVIDNFERQAATGRIARRRFSLRDFCRRKLFGIDAVGSWRKAARLQIERDRG